MKYGEMKSKQQNLHENNIVSALFFFTEASKVVVCSFLIHAKMKEN